MPCPAAALQAGQAQGCVLRLCCHATQESGGQEDALAEALAKVELLEAQVGVVGELQEHMEKQEGLITQLQELLVSSQREQVGSGGHTHAAPRARVRGTTLSSTFGHWKARARVRACARHSTQPCRHACMHPNEPGTTDGASYPR